MKQEGGSHYKGGIQPTEMAMSNDLDCLQFSVIKHITRVGKKGTREDGILDIKKAIHYAQMELEHRYDIRSAVSYEDD